MKELLNITALNLEFEGIRISCPLTDGMRMVPIKPICELIDIQFKNQDSWLKGHPTFSKLYLLVGVVAADGKTRDMNCLPLFDTYAWLASIRDDKRRPGSVAKQTAFMAYLRGRMLDTYKEIALIKAENEMELMLLERKAEIAEERNVLAEKDKRLQKELKDVDVSLTEIRTSRFNNQLKLPFPSTLRPKS